MKSEQFLIAITESKNISIYMVTSLIKTHQSYLNDYQIKFKILA